MTILISTPFVDEGAQEICTGVGEARARWPMVGHSIGSGLYGLPPQIESKMVLLLFLVFDQETKKERIIGYSIREQASLKRCINIRPSFRVGDFLPHLSLTFLVKSDNTHH